MSVIIYRKSRPEIQLVVATHNVVEYLMSGWNITPYSTIKA